jgi:NAD(P)-dependent dehydrogenase (short-subunit alcohol dehydrogenase family)
MKFSLKDKVVLITGASGGVGGASSRVLHAAGARVVVTDISQVAVDKLASEIGGDRVLSLGLDVTDRSAADAAVAETIRRFGGLDMVFANAGIACNPPKTIASMDEATFENVIEVNLLGVCRTVRACLPQIKKRQGHVLVTASIYSFLNGAANAPYAMSKAGVEMFARALRTELAGTGATAGTLYPGWVATPMARPAFGGNETATKLLATVFPWPFNKAIQPEAVARAMLRGVQQRAPRIMVPRRWIPFSYLRGFANALSDWRLDRDSEVHALLRKFET